MKPTLPPGTRDFSGEILRRRRFILDTIRAVFELYGFEPLETPAMENLETLLGKYGDEGDKLIFKILNNGLDLPAKKESALKSFEQVLNGKNEKNITERALRYDLTIPFARYIAMNHGQLTMPFKRYQMQPVWRADRPQKGRYREFYQCDADVAGTNSLVCDAEFAVIYMQVFDELNVPVDIKINSRKILTGLAEICGGATNMIPISIAIDKLDKVGIDKVKEELTGRHLTDHQIAIIEAYLRIDGSNEQRLQKCTELLVNNEMAEEGIVELTTILSYIQALDTSPAGSSVSIDFTLARGLNYYTGVIYEVKARNVQMGSIGGGGRYDDLTSLFGLPGIAGTGISFGVDRIYDVMHELNVFPEAMNAPAMALFFNLGEKESALAFTTMQQLRHAGLACEMFYENAKMDKQFKYASRKQIAFAVIIGSNEMQQKSCIIKNLASGEQETVALENILSYFKK
jgi:histidyl-tRNA synthetase